MCSFRIHFRSPILYPQFPGGAVPHPPPNKHPSCAPPSTVTFTRSYMDTEKCVLSRVL